MGTSKDYTTCRKLYSLLMLLTSSKTFRPCENDVSVVIFRKIYPPIDFSFTWLGIKIHSPITKL